MVVSAAVDEVIMGGAVFFVHLLVGTHFACIWRASPPLTPFFVPAEGGISSSASGVKDSLMICWSVEEMLPVCVSWCSLLLLLLALLSLVSVWVLCAVACVVLLLECDTHWWL